MSSTSLPNTRSPRPIANGLTGRHVLLAMVGFFGVIFAVNGVLLWKALATHSGLVANEPYRKGLAYNERIEADERQRRLGWTDDVQLVGRNTITVALAGDAGAPVTGLEISAVLGRPTTTRQDMRLTLVEVAPGRYEAATGPLEAGAWLVALEARQSAVASAAPVGEPVFRSKKRLWLKP